MNIHAERPGLASSGMPPPPVHLLPRIGSSGAGTFLEEGRLLKQALAHCLPPGFALERGMRLLDFGCGVGRLEFQLVEESRDVEIWGCDIDEESIAWLAAHFGPGFRFFCNGSRPPLDAPPAHFEVVLALSVLTHIPDGWCAWLEELRRVLKPGGLGLLSFQSVIPFVKTVGPATTLHRAGFVVDGAENDWEACGPQVYQSNDWILENWSSVLPVQAIFAEGLGFQSLAVVRKGPATGKPAVLQPFVHVHPQNGFHGWVDYDPWKPRNWWLESGWCERLEPGPLHGWFVSDCAPLRSVHALGAGGRELPVTHTSRPDVAGAHPEVRWAVDAGFTIPRDALLGLGSGKHVVTITAADWDGRVHWLRVQVTIR
ncbi:MAG: class I SAM-dependent methyltransferase [Planctomycetes bacterium]|nr:class I SAM-dependent methyltransferase [Planctomycetota bacterium]